MPEVEMVAPLIEFNWTLIMILVTFVILCLVLKKVFFEKVHNFMEARTQKVQDQFDNADAANKLAEKNLEEYRGRLENIELERRSLLKDARTLAEQRAQEIIQEANKRAEEIIKQAEKEARRERALLVEAMREQIALLALSAAEKIIEKQLDEKEQLLFIDEIIRKDGGEAWKN